MNEFYSYWASHLNISTANWNSDHQFDQPYLQAVLLEGSGETQAFGMRLQWQSLENLCQRLGDFHPDKQSDEERLRAAFGTCHYIHLFREDKISQAVSLLKAEQSGLWHIHSDGTERERLKQGHAPVYDGKALAKHVAELKECDARWISWFTQQNIQPASIKYETLSDDPQTVVAGILIDFGFNPIHAQKIEPKTAKLSNSENHEWAERLRKEQLDPSK